MACDASELSRVLAELERERARAEALQAQVSQLIRADALRAEAEALAAAQKAQRRARNTRYRERQATCSVSEDVSKTSHETPPSPLPCPSPPSPVPLSPSPFIPLPTPGPSAGAEAPAATRREALALTPSGPPEKPARRPSHAQALYQRLEASREEACEAAGVPFVPEAWPVARQNKQLGPVAASDAATRERFQAAWGVYLDDGTNAGRDPPFSLGWFLASRSTWESRALRSAGGAA